MENTFSGATPYVGEIRLVGLNFAINGWAICNGQLLPISEYETLFNLIGTTYGGDGQNTFGIPDLQGRVPIHMGQGAGLPNYTIGEMSGTFERTLTTQQLPAHTHSYTYQPLAQLGAGTTNNPENGFFAAGAGRGGQFYQPLANANTQMANVTTLAQSTSVGGNQPIQIAQPYLVMNYVISLFGIFPSPT
ncbi:phage tail protein [Fibrella sp. HMF5335]|uniref:Phage tail protein n=1 Tax=Fibrella rubiginis TaxID=2817060 RepID=A0A939GJK9_9BACT|nr:tail fiber protein [Fibrella rubiginis]MBO0939511.1 phage tail protein [Fibrella rubiginis]